MTSGKHATAPSTGSSRSSAGVSVGESSQSQAQFKFPDPSKPQLGSSSNGPIPVTSEADLKAKLQSLPRASAEARRALASMRKPPSAVVDTGIVSGRPGVKVEGFVTLSESTPFWPPFEKIDRCATWADARRAGEQIRARFKAGDDPTTTVAGLPHTPLSLEVERRVRRRLAVDASPAVAASIAVREVSSMPQEVRISESVRRAIRIP